MYSTRTESIYKPIAGGRNQRRSVIEERIKLSLYDSVTMSADVSWEGGMFNSEST
jgi:hypothetical protein